MYILLYILELSVDLVNTVRGALPSHRMFFLPNVAYDYHVGQGHEILFQTLLGRAILVGLNAIKVRRVKGYKVRHSSQFCPIMRDPEFNKLVEKDHCKFSCNKPCLDMSHFYTLKMVKSNWLTISCKKGLQHKPVQ